MEPMMSKSPRSARRGVWILGLLTLVRLTTPHSDDGAMRFTVSGPVDSAVVVNPSLQLFTRRVGSTVVGVVVGALASRAVVILHGSDPGGAGYSAQVLEVADRQDLLRPSLAGYALTVTP
jgi:hypothetical protein